MKSKSPITFFLILMLLFWFFYAVFPLEQVKNSSQEVTTNQQLAHQYFQAESKGENTDEDEEKKIEEDRIKKEREKLKAEQERQRRESVKPKTKADKIINFAKTKLNIPYRQAGTTDKGYDCSGLIMTSYKKLGVSLPRASYQMATKGKPVKLSDVQKGDLLFFATDPNKPKKICHVGMVTSVDDEKVHFIHSTNKRGVVISKMDEKYYKKAYIKAKRFLK